MEKVFDVPKNFVCPENFLEPLKWYTDRNGDGGGVAEINLFHKKIFRDSSGTIRKSRANFFPPP